MDEARSPRPRLAITRPLKPFEGPQATELTNKKGPSEDAAVAPGGRKGRRWDEVSPGTQGKRRERPGDASWLRRAPQQRPPEAEPQRPSGTEGRGRPQPPRPSSFPRLGRPQRKPARPHALAQARHDPGIQKGRSHVSAAPSFFPASILAPRRHVASGSSRAHHSLAGRSGACPGALS